MKTLGALLLLALAYTVGLERLFLALDTADLALKNAYERAAAAPGCLIPRERGGRVRQSARKEGEITHETISSHQ